MTTVYDVPADHLIRRVAAKLKESNLEVPEWVEFVKTGAHKELPPLEKDWWYIRCASILRRVYIDGPVGVARLRSYYGGKHRNGATPAVFSKGSGSIIREALQALEKLGYVTSQKGGRVVSPAGRSFLDNTAKEVRDELVEEIPGIAKY